MKFIQESLQSLSARLPELEWKLKTLNIALHAKNTPPGLFYNRVDMTPQSCIAEIKADLRVLAAQANERSGHYLADRISQKINVLVRLCQMHTDKQPAIREVNFGVQMISTRQQWLQTVQDDIAKLVEQQQALASTLAKMQRSDNKYASLSLQAELGEVERRLTLARETLVRNL